MTNKDEPKDKTIYDKDQVLAGVHALCQYVSKTKTELFDEASTQIYLQCGMRKIPRVKNKIIRILLPHSVHRSTSEVCLFVKDQDKTNRNYEPTIEHYEQLLAEKNVTGIAKIIPLKSVKLDYQPFEAKRNLSDMYDAFLTDARIARLLPGLLGKHFYGRKRFPLQVNLEAKDLQSEIKKALLTSQCIVSGRGATCQVLVGHTDLTEGQIEENIAASVTRLAADLPGGAANISNIHIKTINSPAIPVFIATGKGEEVQLPSRKRRLMEPVLEEVDTVEEGKVLVTAHGDIKVVVDGEVPAATPHRKRRKTNKQKQVTSEFFREKKAEAKAAAQEIKTQKQKENISENTNSKNSLKQKVKQSGKVISKKQGVKKLKNQKIAAGKIVPKKVKLAKKGIKSLARHSKTVLKGKEPNRVKVKSSKVTRKNKAKA